MVLKAEGFEGAWFVWVLRSCSDVCVGRAWTRCTGICSWWAAMFSYIPREVEQPVLSPIPYVPLQGPSSGLSTSPRTSERAVVSQKGPWSQHGVSFLATLRSFN